MSEAVQATGTDADSHVPAVDQPARLRRFNIAVQRTRAAVYSLSLLLGLFAWWIDALAIDVRQGAGLVGLALLSALIIDRLQRRDWDARHGVDLFWAWQTIDVALISWGVAITGGLESPWYLWYLSAAAAAAFVRGKNAAYGVSALCATAYVVTLALSGEISGFDRDLALALARMLFLFGAAFFFLRGVSDLRAKRLLIDTLRREESRKVEELTRLATALELKQRELAEANVRIEQADRMKSRFLATMSHELRTPMNSIIGFSEILSDRLDGSIDSRYSEFLRHIVESGHHLLAIINDVLDLSKIEAGKLELHPEPVDLRSTVDGVITIMAAQTSRREITIENGIASTFPAIETDAAKFRQILYNLLANAVKYSPDRGVITVTSTLVGEQREIAEVSVRDRGIGIEPAMQEEIFDEFRQIEDQRSGGGTGLGLALVRRFVQVQGGEAGVESRPGEGSRFWFRLPIRYAGPEPTAPKVREMMPIGSEPLVIVVEDDPAAFEAIRDDLVAGGYRALRVDRGEHAIRAARELSPAAVTLDLVLPGLDGWEVLKTLKSDPDTRDIPVVIISMVDSRELGLALGAHEYFVKPVEPKRLVERLQQITDGGEATRVVVIDDDPMFHDLVDDELRLLGFDVEHATTGDEGFEILVSRGADLVILDLVLPGSSGFEIAERIASDERTAGTPIVVMTEHDLTPDDRERLGSRISALIGKGRTAKTRLVAAIRQIERKPDSAAKR